MTRLCIVAVVVCLGCVIMIGCKESSKPGALPQGASIQKDYGNGWVVFYLDGNTFLFYRDNTGYGGRCAITQIQNTLSQVTGRWEKVDGELRFEKGGR